MQYSSKFLLYIIQAELSFLIIKIVKRKSRSFLTTVIGKIKSRSKYNEKDIESLIEILVNIINLFRLFLRKNSPYWFLFII